MAVLDFPSVGQLVAALLAYPQDAKVIIVDADTAWTINHIHHSLETDGVNLSGEYSEMERQAIKEVPLGKPSIADF